MDYKRLFKISWQIVERLVCRRDKAIPQSGWKTATPTSETLKGKDKSDFPGLEKEKTLFFCWETGLRQTATYLRAVEGDRTLF